MRLPDAILDACLCDPQAPLAQDPARDFGLSKAQARQTLEALRPWLNERQRMLWANRHDALLLLLQGPDCSGKDGVIRQVINAFDPQGLHIQCFQEPTEEERRQHFLERYRQQLPPTGMLGVFNRSYYETLVSDPRVGFCREDELPARQTQILDFERSLGDRRIHVLKVYLHLSHEEQGRRLQRRLELPSKRWKLQAADLQSWHDYDELRQCWSRVLSASHTSEAPWFVLPADHRWLRNLLVAGLLARTLQRLQLDWPDTQPPFSLEDMGRP